MKESTKQSLNQDLEDLEKKISKISSSDPEKHSEFSSRLSSLQSKFIGLSDIELERQKVNLISEISILDDDFSSYMDGYDHDPGASLNFDSKIESGRAKLKNYRFNLYTSIFRDFEKLDYIKLEQLTSLKSQWEIDKTSSDYQYSPIEISAMEQYLSDAFLEYQLKALKVKGAFPTEKITKFVSLEEYQSSIKRKISKTLENPDILPIDRLELDTLLNKTDLTEILRSPVLLQSLTGKQHTLSQGEVKEILGEEKQEQNQNQEPTKKEEPSSSTDLVPITKTKKSSKYMICVIAVPNKFFNRGKEHYKQVKVKINNPNDIHVPFEYQDKVVSVILPEGTTVIPPNTFESCKRLTEAILPSTLKHIGEGAFQGLYNLQRVNLPKGLETVGDYAFWNCYNLNNVEFPESLKTIGHYSYINCTKLKTVKLPSRLQKLGEGAFEGCIGLEEFNCSENLETIPPSLLKGCTNLTNIKFSKNLLRIGRSAFEGCKKLTSLTNIPNTLERIEDSAFYRCEKLSIIDLPDSLRYLGSGSLSFLTNLFQLKLPNIMTDIGQGALTGNVNLKEVLMPQFLGNAKDILYNTFNPNLRMIIPEKPKGDFYEKLGISTGTTILAPDFSKKYHDIQNINEKREQSTVRDTKISQDDDLQV